MRTSYDLDADTFYARFAPDSVLVEGTSEVVPGIVMTDFDADGNVVGIEVLNAILRGRKAAPAADKPARLRVAAGRGAIAHGDG